MFQEALLESAPALRRRNHWPMATAFTLELMVASVLVLLPLISTGIIQLKTTTTLPTPPRFTPIVNNEPVRQTGGPVNVALSRPVVAFTNPNHRVINPYATNTSRENTDAQPNFRIGTGSPSVTDLLPPGQPIAVEPPPPPKRVIISHSIEAMLVKKVIPEYPQIAKITGMQGDVKLHAIIARDGTIQSLSVVSSPFPALTQAALAAVEQWRYRPYLLNNQAVEVETVITVSFIKSR